MFKCQIPWIFHKMCILTCSGESWRFLVLYALPGIWTLVLRDTIWLGLVWWTDLGTW